LANSAKAQNHCAAASAAPVLIFAAMPSVTRELQRRQRVEPSLPCFEPRLPRTASMPPVGPGWTHEIKHEKIGTLC
jgi:hypothetical protein